MNPLDTRPERLLYGPTVPGRRRFVFEEGWGPGWGLGAVPLADLGRISLRHEEAGASLLYPDPVAREIKLHWVSPDGADKLMRIPFPEGINSEKPVQITESPQTLYWRDGIGRLQSAVIIAGDEILRMTEPAVIADPQRLIVPVDAPAFPTWVELSSDSGQGFALYRHGRMQKKDSPVSG